MSTPSKQGIAFFSRKQANTAIEIPRDEQNEPPVNDTKDEQPEQMTLVFISVSSSMHLQ